MPRPYRISIQRSRHSRRSSELISLVRPGSPCASQNSYNVSCVLCCARRRILVSLNAYPAARTLFRVLCLRTRCKRGTNMYMKMRAKGVIRGSHSSCISFPRVVAAHCCGNAARHVNLSSESISCCSALVRKAALPRYSRAIRMHCSIFSRVGTCVFIRVLLVRLLE